MIVLTTPTGTIGAQVLRMLVDDPRAEGRVRVIVRDPAKLDPEVADRVEVVTGSHGDAAVLDQAFAGADTVFWLVPPDPTTDDPTRQYLDFTEAAVAAIERQGVRRVVGVTSLGHGFAGDAGLLSAAFAMDDVITASGVAYRALALPYFMENLLGQAEPLARDGVLMLLNDPEQALDMVATADVAAAAADLLLDPTWTGSERVAVMSDTLTPREAADVIAATVGRSVRLVHAEPDGFTAAMVGRGLSEAFVHGLVAMAAAQDAGIYGLGDQTMSAAAPTTFRRWCERELRPRTRAVRAAEIREAFDHLRSVDPVLARLIDRRPDYDADAWRAELPTMDLFGCLVFQVVGQQLSVTAAKAILGRIMAAVGGHLPSPSELAGFDQASLRELGVSWRKAATLLDLAERFADGRLSEDRLSALPDDEVVAELTQIAGIGPWTVHGALLIALGRGDVVPAGDIMLRNSIQACYALEALPTEQQVRDLTEPWSPHRSLGVNLLFAAYELDGLAGTAGKPKVVARA